MPSLSVTDLPWPSAANRIDLIAPDFETAGQAEIEDVLRAKSARSQARKHGGEWGERANALANLIDPKLQSEFPSTLASSRFFRLNRIQVCGALHQFVTEVGDGSFFRADIIKPGWACDFADLHNLNPNRLLAEFRADVLRVLPANTKNGFRNGLAPTPGDFIFAGIHGEFDPLALRYQSHLHVGGSGVYVEAIDRVRKLKGYCPTVTVRNPVRIKRTIYDLPGAITYLVKSYWPQRPFLPLGANGALKRPRGHNAQRINEPYHTDYLLWLDQWTLSDIVLLMGVRAGKQGLVLT